MITFGFLRHAIIVLIMYRNYYDRKQKTCFENVTLISHDTLNELHVHRSHDRFL